MSSAERILSQWVFSRTAAGLPFRCSRNERSGQTTSSVVFVSNSMHVRQACGGSVEAVLVAGSTGPFKHFRPLRDRPSCLNSVAFPSRHNGACDFRKAHATVLWDNTSLQHAPAFAGQLLFGERRPCVGQLLRTSGRFKAHEHVFHPGT